MKNSIESEVEEQRLECTECQEYISSFMLACNKSYKHDLAAIKK